jgi:hypothetical protein
VAIGILPELVGSTVKAKGFLVRVTAGGILGRVLVCSSSLVDLGGSIMMPGDGGCWLATVPVKRAHGPRRAGMKSAPLSDGKATLRDLPDLVVDESKTGSAKLFEDLSPDELTGCLEHLLILEVQELPEQRQFGLAAENGSGFGETSSGAGRPKRRRSTRSRSERGNASPSNATAPSTASRSSATRQRPRAVAPQQAVGHRGPKVLRHEEWISFRLPREKST